MTLKKHTVVMLPTNQKAQINLNKYRKDIPTLCLDCEIVNYKTNPYEIVSTNHYSIKIEIILLNLKINKITT